VKLQLTNKFLHRVRIHGGEFDSSARAMNRAGEKDTLITYERALEAQADLRKFRGSTIERKQMSTKTTFKRVALVAVAALGLGTVSVAPSQAAPVFAEVTVAAAGEAIVGGVARVKITFDTATITSVAVTGVGSVLGTTQDTATVIGTPTSGSWSVNEPTTAGANPAGTQTITLTSAVAGTTTITATPTNASTGAPGTAVTKTIKWVAATTVGTYDHATAFIQARDTTDRLYVDSTTAELTLASTLNATADASIQITQFNSADTVTATTLPAAGTKAVTVAITGAGAVGTSAANAGPSVTIAAATANASTVYVYADGRNGTATISVTVNGVLISTKTVSFFGAVSAYAASTTTGETLGKNYIGVSETAAVTIKGLDALKTVMASGTIYATPETATIASASVSGSVVTVTGVALGKTNITVHNAATVATSTITYKFAIEVTEKTAKSYKVAFDSTTYAPGAKVTWTVTATTATGRPIADGSRAVLGTSTTNVSAPVGTLPTGSLTFVDGVATSFFYAPATTGDFVITTVEGAAIDAVIASATYTAATTANTVSVTSATQDAALDAANEATDAANAATDAALAAADAADAATAAAEDASAAVAALAKSVNTALNNLKKQITALTKLVNKLLK